MTKTVKLAEGVNLHLLPSKKYKTVHFMVRFRELASRETLAERAILANLLTMANAKYPHPKDFQAALAMNFGMRLGAGTTSKGLQHNLTFGMNVVEPAFVGEDTLAKAVELLRAVIFEPLAENGSFNAQIFDLIKTNGLHDLASLKDDNAYMAAVKLDQLFYTDINMATPSHGTVELMEHVDAAGLYAYYLTMLATNSVDIYVLGNVDDAAMTRAFKDWNFSDRMPINDIFYSQAVKEETELIKSKEAYQSQLAMAWLMPIQYGDSDYLALQVFNGLFGGQPNSKLFSIVRERESLAYGINSRFDSFTGMMSVMAGVDDENLLLARDLVIALLEELKNGDFSEEDLSQTKALLRNGYLAGKDSPSSQLEMAFVAGLLPERELSDEEWLANLEAVKSEDVQRVAQKLKIQVTYMLKSISLTEELEKDESVESDLSTQGIGGAE
ncbi:MAG: insulinase family protein [Streptococcaceae bacterium]|jgi:predicted Zn-dependent peptidase|nr:insulinase family protein [Streptococcaceae bacterium]